MKLLQLRYFQAICKHNNITHASNELHVSQPSLSNVIKDLEDEFGVSLFYRLSKGLILTEEGTILLERATAILNLADSLSAEMKMLSTAKQEITLGLPPMIGSTVFPDILHGLRAAYTNLKLTVVEHGSLKIKSMVIDGKLDAAIISGNDPLPSSLDSVYLCTLKILFYTSIESSIAYMTELDIQQLDTTPLVTLKEDSFINYYVKQIFKNNSITPNIVLYTNQLNTIKRLVDNNTASTFLYEGILELTDNIISIPLKENDNIKIRLIWNKNRKQTSHFKKLVNFIKTQSRNK